MRDGPHRGGRVRVSTHVPWVGMEGGGSGRIQVAGLSTWIVYALCVTEMQVVETWNGLKVRYPTSRLGRVRVISLA